jgi:large subunit ribosomal protein L25
MDATSRTLTGKGASRKIRRTGMIPAVVYREGKSPSLITINPYTLTLLFEKTRNPNTLVTLEIENGTKATCLVKEVQRHPVTAVIRHVDFYEVSEKEEIVVSVPVETEGKSKGLTLGGVVRLITRNLDVRCKPQFIPDTIKIDVTELDIGGFIKVNDVVNPKGATILSGKKGNFNVVTVSKRRGTTA